MSKFIFFSLLTFAFLSSCKNSTQVKELFHPMSIQKEIIGEDLAEIRARAAKQIDYRSTNNPKDILILAGDWWKIDGYFNVDSVASARNENYWLKLEKDFTYRMGNGADISETGRCHYDDEKTSLIQLPDNENLQPKEWQLKYGGDQFVLFGTQTYGVNNGMQIKFILTSPPL